MKDGDKVRAISPNLIFYGNYCDAVNSLNDIRIYLSEFNNHINQRLHSLEAEKKEVNHNYSVENLKHHYHYTFSTLLYDSSIISIYSILEIEIGNYCSDFKKYVNSSLNISEFKGDLLGRFKIYSTKVIGSDFNFNNPIWEYIIGLQELRNCLVHNRGQSEGFSRQKELFSFIKKNKKIIVAENGYVQVSQEACLDILDNVKIFFKEITKVALKRFPGAYTHDRIT